MRRPSTATCNVNGVILEGRRASEFFAPVAKAEEEGRPTRDRPAPSARAPAAEEAAARVALVTLLLAR